MKNTTHLLCLLLLISCQPPSGTSQASDPPPSSSRPEWALAIHGGAGTLPKTMAAERREAYLRSLSSALALGQGLLESGESSLDVVEQVIRQLEDDPLFNSGKGAVYTAEGRHELDASVMDGKDRSCGAVTGVVTVKHPISLARLVMERTPHVFLSGAGAEAFADETEIERVSNDYFSTPYRREQWEKSQKSAHGTVGVVALDRDGHLAAGTSTGGMTGKRFGRIGDSPVIGAGTWADDATCAVSCTGHGEKFIRNTVAREVAALMEHRGLSLEEAARKVIHEDLEPGDGGLVAVSGKGEIALVFNTEGMYRGAADSGGRFEVQIWD